MSEADDLPRADQAEGAPHPRETVRLYGHAQAEADFLHAFSSERLHHAWLIMGPRGVGKSTLAWRIARFLLATPPVEEDGLFGAPPPPSSLDIDPDHPVSHRMQALAEPGMAAITRSYNDKGRLRDQIDGTGPLTGGVIEAPAGIGSVEMDGAGTLLARPTP